MQNSQGKVEVRTVGVQPGGHRWQDLFNVKNTFDARRVTKHGSQTEVMMIFVHDLRSSQYLRCIKHVVFTLKC